MANTVNFSLRMDSDIKKQCENLYNELGMNLTTAINVFLRKVAREGRIPFELSVDPFYSESNLRHLENIMRDVKDGTAHFAEHDLIEAD